MRVAHMRVIRAPLGAAVDRAVMWNGFRPANKKGQLAPAEDLGIYLLRNRPDPDDPGGLGAEESGAERTGSTQCLFIASQNGGGLTEFRPHYDLANVRVMRW